MLPATSLFQCIALYKLNIFIRVLPLTLNCVDRYEERTRSHERHHETHHETVRHSNAAPSQSHRDRYAEPGFVKGWSHISILATFLVSFAILQVKWGGLL